jgi:hypothetical protein
MALIECTECKKQISDKASACPQCGAPVSATSNSQSANTVSAPKKKTSWFTWLVAVVLAVSAIWYFPKAQKEANLPPMPVEVKFRKAVLGPGLVLQVKNTSSRHLSLMVALKNPSTNQEKTYRLDAAPSTAVEVGHKEGWILASGDQLQITHNDYKAWNGSIP